MICFSKFCFWFRVDFGFFFVCVQVEELKAGVMELDGKCDRLVQEKEQLVREHKKRTIDLKEQCEENFGGQLRNIDQQWK